MVDSAAHYVAESDYTPADTGTLNARDGKALCESGIQPYIYTAPEVFAIRSYKSTINTIGTEIDIVCRVA